MRAAKELLPRVRALVGMPKRKIVGGGEAEEDPFNESLVLWKMLEFANDQAACMGFLREDLATQRDELARNFSAGEMRLGRKQYKDALKALRAAVPSSDQGTGTFLPFVLSHGRGDALAALYSNEGRIRRLREKFFD